MSDWEGEHCQVCGDAYEDVYWLPDAWWAKITPKPEHPKAGLLCPDCALARLLARSLLPDVRPSSDDQS